MYKHRTFQFLEEFKGKLFDGEVPTLAEMFQIAAARYPDKKCLSTYNPVLFNMSFRETREKILTLAASLVAKGVKKGDHVILTGKNSPEWAVGYYAIATAGAVIVPLDYSLHVEELKNLINFSEPAAAILDEEKYSDLAKCLPEGTPVYSLTDKNPDYVLALKDTPLEKPVKVDVHETAAILYTSGTTGTPKGVMLSHYNLINDCFLAQMHMQIYHTDVFYALLPVHHAYTMQAVIIVGLAQSAEVVFAKRLVIKEMLADLRDGKVTIFLGVPMLFNKLLAQIMKGVRAKGIVTYGIVKTLMAISGFLKSCFGIKIGKKLFGKLILEKVSLLDNRICISGGGPLPPSTFKMYNQLGLDFVQGYGLTETSPIVALNPIYRFKIKSVGKVLPDIQVKIVAPDKDGRGEIAFKGPVVMQGYYKNQAATDEVMDNQGFFYTGDMGYVDKENYLYLTGRKKNIIVTAGGKNVFPEEIEDRFQLYPEIEQILVRGYINENGKHQDGEEIEALIYPSEDLRKTDDPELIRKKLEEIVSNVNKILQSYMKITRVRAVDKPFEESSTKKIKRYKVGN